MEGEKMRAFSYGGGVQSTAALILAAQGRIDFPLFMFANVGEDSEYPATLEYFNKYARPYAERHGIEMVELRKRDRKGNVQTIYSKFMRPGNKWAGLPMRLSRKNNPARRNCTVDFKLAVIAKELKRRGASEQNPVTVGIGFSIDEMQRMRTDDPTRPWEHKEYPLIGLRLSRQDCGAVILREGLPLPPKSSCFFCPFHTLRDWQRLKLERPDLYDKTVAMERHINEGRKEPMYFTDYKRPLDAVLSGEIQHPLPEVEPGCDVGHCFT
jgi:hypothetical protein